MSILKRSGSVRYCGGMGWSNYSTDIVSDESKGIEKNLHINSRSMTVLISFMNHVYNVLLNLLDGLVNRIIDQKYVSLLMY